jgi:hypothetical protein
MTPEQIGAMVVEAVEHNRFFILADPTSQQTLVRRTADWNVFLEDRLAALRVATTTQNPEEPGV